MNIHEARNPSELRWLSMGTLIGHAIEQRYEDNEVVTPIDRFRRDDDTSPFEAYPQFPSLKMKIMLAK